jgi:hypothetical protein
MVKEQEAERKKKVEELQEMQLIDQKNLTANRKKNNVSSSAN